MTFDGEHIGAAAPAVVRLAGLPIDTLQDFTSDLPEILAETRQLAERLAAAREVAVDALFEVVGDDDYAHLRPLLLAAKRSCFNGRPLKKQARNPLWDELVERVGDAPAEVLRLETELDASRAAFAERFEAHRLSELDALGRLVRNPFFRCGMAVASPVVAEQSRRLAEKPAAKHGRRERRLTPTVLRYAGRATLKLSPFSTFTALGAGEIVDEVSEVGYRRNDQAPEADFRSLARLRRHLLDRCLELLRRDSVVRAGLVLAVNDSVTSTVDGKSCFLRPSGWYVDEDAKKFSYRRESLVKLSLGAPVFDQVAAHVAEHRTFGAVAAAMAEESGSLDEAIQGLEQMLDIGWLVFVHPWNANQGHLEVSLLDFLKTRHGSDAHLADFTATLERLVELQAGLHVSERPWQAGREIDRLIDTLMENGRDLAGLDGIDVTHRSTDNDLYQDVWAVADTPALSLDRGTADALLDDIRPLVRYARLFDQRLEWLRTLGELVRRRGDGPRPVLDVFEELRGEFQDYVKFFVASRSDSGVPGTWNPLELDDIAGLERRRGEAADALERLCRDVDGVGRCLDGRALDRLLDTFPAVETTPIGGACLFLQPASADDSLWMVNRIKEGSGRFGSRYSPVMDPRSRRNWTHEMSRRSHWHDGRERVDFLDVQSVQGDTLNVHDTQTPKALVFPGDTSDLSADRRRSLQDLMVHVDADGRAELRDRDGVRLAPVHLGVGYLDYMPTLTKFLCSFGPSEMGSIFPKPWVRKQGETLFCERTRVGKVVIHRRSWTFELEPLRERLDGLDDVAAFQAIDVWRREHGIPMRGFIRERVGHPIIGYRYQPQFVDFSSPGFVKIFVSMLEADVPRLTLAETLPDPELFRRPENGGRAFEVLLDEAALPRGEARVDTPLQAETRNVNAEVNA